MGYFPPKADYQSLRCSLPTFSGTVRVTAFLESQSQRTATWTTEYYTHGAPFIDTFHPPLSLLHTHPHTHTHSIDVQSENELHWVHSAMDFSVYFPEASYLIL